MNTAALIAVDALAWFAIQAGSGYLVHRIPVERLDHDTWLSRERSFEAGGAFYRRTLRIGRWKGLLPEAGATFKGGFDKRRLTATDDDHLARYVVETRRAELGHWLAAAPAPLFALWNPATAAVLMLVYAAAVNGPCIASQRYNRLRLTRLQERRSARRR